MNQTMLVSSINFISIKHYIEIHQDKKEDIIIYTTKSYGGVGWKASEADNSLPLTTQTTYLNKSKKINR